jgi:hypothetical protein
MSARVSPFDLNLAPEQVARQPAQTWERPRGHRHDSSNRDVGGGILGSPPPRLITGMSNNPLPRTHDFLFEEGSSSSRSAPKPKIEFPRFDGQNPRLWKDRCELYLEVYSVSDALKPRFAALNFEETAAAWLQTVELRDRISSWHALHTAVCERFD